MLIRNRWRAWSLAAVMAAALAVSACTSGSGSDSGGGDSGGGDSEGPDSEGSDESEQPEQSSSVPAATLTGPVTGGEKGRFFGAALADLDSFGYVEEEYFIEGDARTYGPAPETTLDADGHWSVVETGSVPYKSRMIVRRPTDPNKFNGTVMVVWLNATAGFEIGDFGDPQLLERGYAQVFVSAQRDGIEGESITGMSILPGLKEWDPTRYGSLSIPSNDVSFDIYSQAAATIGPDRETSEVDPMAGMDVQQLVAYGGSQSAAWLLTYYNGVQPTAQVFDGFMPIQHFGTGRPLAEGVEMPTTLRFRDDSPTPVMLLNGEGEAAAYAPSIQPDTDTFRLWEYAGINHTGGTPGANLLAEFSQRDFEFPFPTGSCDRPVNTLDTRYIFPNGVVAVDRWLRDGTAPTRAVPITVIDGEVVRDSLGIAIGGIKIPQVAVPTSAHGAPNGEREADLICYLQGYEVPFDEATIARLYPTHEAYVAAIDAATTELELRGFILAEDAEAERLRAEQSSIGSPTA